MYALVDRPVAALSPGSRLLLWAMRRWTAALSAGTCPPGALVPAFAQQGAIDALPPFHRFMGLLNGRAEEMISFSPVSSGAISEWEAVLLTLWSDASARPQAARDMLALLLQEEVVEPSFEALLEAAGRMDQAGLVPSGLSPARLQRG